MLFSGPPPGLRLNETYDQKSYFRLASPRLNSTFDKEPSPGTDTIRITGHTHHLNTGHCQTIWTILGIFGPDFNQSFENQTNIGVWYLNGKSRITFFPLCTHSNEIWGSWDWPTGLLTCRNKCHQFLQYFILFFVIKYFRLFESTHHW